MITELQRIEPRSLTKITTLLGLVWGTLGWLVGSILVLIIRLTTAQPELLDLPVPFAISGLLGSILSGVLGGAISGFVGAYVYNLIAEKVGGIFLSFSDGVTTKPVQRPTAPTMYASHQSEATSESNASTI